MKHYGAAFVTVLICILISVICNVQGTMFMQTLIDDYIVPMLKDGSRDFPVLHTQSQELLDFMRLE